MFVSIVFPLPASLYPPIAIPSLFRQSASTSRGAETHSGIQTLGRTSPVAYQRMSTMLPVALWSDCSFFSAFFFFFLFVSFLPSQTITGPRPKTLQAFTYRRRHPYPCTPGISLASWRPSPLPKVRVANREAGRVHKKRFVYVARSSFAVFSFFFGQARPPKWREWRGRGGPVLF